MSDHHHATVGSITINGESLTPIGVDPGIKTGSITVEGRMRPNANQYRAIWGRPMPHSVQARFQYRGARERRHELTSSAGWLITRTFIRAFKELARAMQPIVQAWEEVMSK